MIILTSMVPKGYRWYDLQGYAESLLTIDEVKKLYKKLYKIPRKITAFIKREIIVDAYKYDTFTYFISTVDGKIFVLDY